MGRPRTRSPAPADDPTAGCSAESVSEDARHSHWVSQQFPALRDTVYVDYAAAPPAPAAPIAALAQTIQTHLLSNPHSASTAGVDTGLLVDRTRTRVLQELFNVPENRLGEWDVVFTQGGATQGIKLVGEGCNWRQPGTGLEYLVESHTSLVGLRGYALAQECRVVAHQTPEELLRSAANRSASPSTSSAVSQPSTLYTYPAQCNATGARLGLRFAAQIKRADPEARVLVDAAAYSSTSVLDLGTLPPAESPDFVVASVYKILGFPTSLGLLLVRRESAHHLTHSPYFGGGAISSLTLSAPFSHVPRVQPREALPSEPAADPSRTDIHTVLEAGTPPYLEIAALSHALDWLDSSTDGAGLGAVSRRTARLRRILVGELAQLRHGDGTHVFREHRAFRGVERRSGPADRFRVLLEEPGPTVGFSLRLPGAGHNGSSRSVNPDSEDSYPEDYRQRYVGHVALSRLALINGIALRSGGLCNTGVWSKVWGFDDHELKELERSGRKCWDEEEFEPFAPFKPLGITRVSLGMASTTEDVRAFVAFVKKFFVDESVPRDPIKSCSSQSLSVGTSWPLTPAGLLYDREFMLVSASTGRALSQKRYPRMALIRPRVDLDKQVLVVEAEGMPKLALSLGHQSGRPCDSATADWPPTPPLSEEETSDPGTGVAGAPNRDSRARMTNLCGSSVESVSVAEDADAWFTAFLNPSSQIASAAATPTLSPSSIPRRDASGPGPVELRRLPTSGSRHAHFDTAGQSSPGPTLPLRLSNESPFLLVSEESLGALNGWILEGHPGGEGERLARPVRAEAFRPNLVVGATSAVASDRESAQELAPPPFWEETVDGLRVGGRQEDEQVFSTLGKCRRCLMVAVDQTTGERCAEPLQTLSQRKKAADTGRVEFGMHCMWRADAATEVGPRRKEVSLPSVTVGAVVSFSLVGTA
ncbi:hypothetical protein JCM8202v2_001068 [Rhodotorula sphaerocarpa]